MDHNQCRRTQERIEKHLKEAEHLRHLNFCSPERGRRLVEEEEYLAGCYRQSLYKAARDKYFSCKCGECKKVERYWSQRVERDREVEAEAERERHNREWEKNNRERFHRVW